MIDKIDKKQSLQFSMKPISFQEMGSKLIRATCYLLGIGPNRNGSNITKDAVYNANKSLKHLPVVANIIQDEDGSYRVGGHDMEIDFSGNEIHMKPLTVPVGCVAGDCDFEFIELEEDNGAKREYLKCDIILWNHMSPIMEAVYSNNVYFNESIEIEVLDAEFDKEDGYLRINEFVYEKACILGLCEHDKTDISHVEPCFVQSRIYPKQYSFTDDFNKQFALLLKEISDFNSSTSQNEDMDDLNIESTQPESDNDMENVAINNDKEEGAQLAKVTKPQLDQEKVNAKLFDVISENKFRSSNTDKHYNKYEILSNTDSIVNVIDRECYYNVYSIPYLATEANGEIIINVDYDSKQEKSFGIVDKSEDLFNIQNEVEMVSLDVATFKVSEHQSAAIGKLSDELETMTENYSIANSEIKRLTEQLAVFQKEKEAFMEKKHKDEIDVVIASKRDEMGKYSKYLDYCISPDYSKSIEEVENDLKEIRYEFLDSTSKHSNKASFSAIETKVTDVSNDNIIAKLYGADVAKYFNN